MAAAGSYLVVPLVGPDGVGKSMLLRAVAEANAMNDPSAPRMPRAVSVGGFSCDVLDVRAPSGVVQLVDFPSVVAERALLPTAGASAVVLVVNAKDSVVAGTRDALLGAHQLGLRVAAGVVTQCDDVADVELSDLVVLEVTELLAKHSPHAAPPPVVAVGSRAAMEGVPRWRAAMQPLLRAIGCG